MPYTVKQDYTPATSKYYQVSGDKYSNSTFETFEEALSYLNDFFGEWLPKPLEKFPINRHVDLGEGVYMSIEMSDVTRCTCPFEKVIPLASLYEIKICLDDERQAPDGWQHVKTATEAILLLQEQNCATISLDNDLGLPDEEGYDVLKFLEEKAFNDKDFKIPEIMIHTANPVARQKMKAGLENIQKLKDQKC